MPLSEQFEDVDFGATPTLFRGTVTPTGATRNLVGAVNKNGTYYVFDRSNLHAGPVARLKSADNPKVCGSACVLYVGDTHGYMYAYSVLGK